MCNDFHGKDKAAGARPANDLRLVRQVLKKSQSELASLLGISTRAVQSYEQGWRPIPPNVLRLSWLLLSLDRQKSSGPVKPCWKVNDCTKDDREKCAVYEFQAGNVCWLISDMWYHGEKLASADRKMKKCLQCPVIKRWLPRR